MTTLDNPITPTNGQPIWNTVIRYGTYLALASIVLSLLFYLGNLNLFSFSGMAISFLLMLGVGFAFAVLAMRHQRDQLDNGIISYGKAFLIGLLVVFASSIVSGIWNYILTNFIDPEYVNALKEQFANTWGDKMPADQLEKTLAEFDKSSSIGAALRQTFINGAIFSLIISLIAAAFMKREPRMDYMR